VSEPSKYPDAYKDVVGILQSYFDGLYYADSNILADVFHPDAHYVNTVKRDYMNYSISEYFKIVDQRKSPASQGEPRNDRILSIEFGGQRMAFVKAKMTMMGRDYLDFLTLTFDENGWRVMSKLFTYSPEKRDV